MPNNSVIYLFPLLSLLACLSLWGIFISNGAFTTMGQNMTKGVLADGRQLRTVYTGIKPIDGFLVNMVSFTFPVATESFPLGRLFLMNFLGELTPIVVIFTVEGRMAQNQKLRKSSRLTTLWLITYQTVAGALVVPLYFFCRLKWPAPKTARRALPASIVRTLLPSIVLGYLFPAAMSFYSSGWPLFENQFWIGIFQLFPVLIPTARLVLSAVLDAVDSPGKPGTSGRGTSPLKTLYIFAAIVSMLTHLYTTAKVLAHEELSLWEFYIPNLQVSGFDSKVLVFLQFDYLIVMLATILWMWLESPEASPLTNWVLALLAWPVLGPGAVVGLTRAIQEEELHH